ncbi:TlpA family protein disulfide reductase [Jiella pacifica]|uniref:Redoxin family protein n=2 Tax=Aurantimonadaceae TaxID=255475 RepID=A0A6N9T955_9HYPH|nr:TlpA disulfide reductase family protein [Jiella pacifica]MCK5932206.1 TlpA family protein disulfide reductase [Fulvimarina manganoxydans]NDW07974.1 redoxin family protein [Jiella pacifica]
MRMTRGRLLFALLVICLGLAGAGTLLLKAEPSGATRTVADLTFENSEGNSVSLADFRGQAVLLNIWATWCPPCREEMPSLDRLQAELGGPDFEVVPLSIDRNGLDAVRPFFAEIGIENLDIYLDRPADSMKALNVLGLPTTLLIDSNGRELQRWAGPKEWDSPEVIAEIRGYLDLTDASSRSDTVSQ